MNQMYGAYPPQSFPQGANALGGWQNPQSIGYQGFGNQNGFQQPYRPGIPGRVVQDITEVRPNEVPGDGSPAIFVKNDMSCVYVKYLSNVGKIETLIYEQAASQQAQNNYLVSQLRPAPNPAYIVQNPNAAVGCNGLTGCCNMAS